MIDLAYFDFLSPRITLYHGGRIRHSSIFSGILTLVSYFVCIIIAIYSSLDMLKHKKPTAYFYKSFNNETGYYSLDSKGLFHFVQFMNSTHQLFQYNSKVLRIKGVREVLYSNNPNILEDQEHWVYDSCDNSIDLGNFEDEVQHIIGSFNGGACLKYFYNPDDKKYYKLGNNNFTSPYLIHGNSRPDNLYYSIIIEKCRNDSIENFIFGNQSCASEDEINDFYNNFIAVYLQIIDYNVDIDNFKRPVKSILYPISTGVHGLNYAQHNLNFSPLLFRTHSNFFRTKKKEIKAFLFDENRKNAKDNTEFTTIYCEFVFWMQNNFQIYERFYKSFSDVLANVGGIFEAIITFSSCINFYYHRYMVKYNSLILFGEKDKNFLVNDTNEKKKDLDLTLNKNYINHTGTKFLQNSNIGLKMKNEMSNITNHPNNMKLLNLHNNDLRIKKNNYLQISNVSTFRKIKINSVNLNFKFSFVSYLLYCKNNNQRFCLNLIDNFRKKLLSEEHLYRNHLDLFYIERYMNFKKEERIDINEIYKRL